jgi:L-erythrulose 1-phosphate isomerase
MGDKEVLPFWLGTSWKMNKTLGESARYAAHLREYVSSSAKNGREYFLIPPHTAIATVAAELNGSNIHVGAQNIHHEDNGAHTGDISAEMVADAGAVIIEIGHQERRRDHQETDALINKKVLRSLAWRLRPLVCIGDTAEDRHYGTHLEAVRRQVKIALNGLTADDLESVLLAYEPAWSIGINGIPATPDQIAEMHSTVQDTLTELYGPAPGLCVPVLYGGSVTADNAADLALVPGVHGLFVGRAALHVENFIRISDALNTTTASQR